MQPLGVVEALDVVAERAVGVRLRRVRLVVDELGSPDDFIGHAGGDNFVIVSKESASAAIRSRLKSRFEQEAVTHYNFMDREQGFILAPDEDGNMVQTPLMTLAVGLVSPATDVFSDIREITELAAEARRRDAGVGNRS